MGDDRSKPQQDIITYPSGGNHMLVLAAAGSGKTRVISERVGHLLDQRQVEPEQIVVMTFTETAAAELVERLEDRLASAVQGIRIGTIHHICNRLLEQFGAAIGIAPGYKIYDAQRQDEVLQHAAIRVGRKLIDRQGLNTLRRTINRHRQQHALALSYGKPEPPFNDRGGAPVAQAYRQYLQAHTALDFDDLIFHGLRLFDTQINPDLAPEIHRQVRYVFIDEFHDLALEQVRFLELLVPPNHPGRQVLVVADPNQAIYGWRDAHATRTIAYYRRSYRPVEFQLHENYRSAGNLVRAAQHLLAASGTRVEVVPIAADDYPIDLVCCPDTEAEATWLAHQIKRACQSGSYGYGDIALLYRANGRADLLEVTLLREGIPLQRDQENRFFDHPDVQATIRYLSLIQALRDESFAALHWPRVLVDEVTMAQLQRVAAAEGLSLSELARRIDDYGDQVSPLTRTVIKDFLDIFEVDLAQVADRPIGVIVQHLLAVLNRRRNPFTYTLREPVKGVLDNLTRPLEPLASAVSTAIDTGRHILLVHDGAIDHAAGALILAHILDHYIHHPVTIQRPQDRVPKGAFTISMGQPRPPDQHGAGIGVYTTRLGTLAYHVSMQAWRLGQMVLMRQETQRQGRFVFVDLETTGTHVRTTEILELAALEVEQEHPTGRSFTALAQPAGRIPPAASQIHGITWDQVKAKPPIDQILPDYLGFLSDATLVGHNIETFDYPVLSRIAHTVGLSAPAGPLIDTYKLARRLLPDSVHRLETLAQQFGYQEAQTHHALADVQMNVHVFFRLLDLMDHERILDIATEVIPLVAIGMHAGTIARADDTLGIAQAGARARAVGLGTSLCAALGDLVTERGELAAHMDWLAGVEHADPDEDQRWDDLAQRWQDALHLYRQVCTDQSLASFLRYVQLATPSDQRLGAEDRVTLMTIHRAKGKEWPVVFIVGAEDGTIPLFHSQTEEAIEEERRVLYVAMTRAKRRLCLSHLEKWKGYPKIPSRFLASIPEELFTRRVIRGATPKRLVRSRH